MIIIDSYKFVNLPSTTFVFSTVGTFTWTVPQGSTTADVYIVGGG